MGHGDIDIHGMDGRKDAIRLEQMLNLPARRAMIGQAGRLPGVRSWQQRILRSTHGLQATSHGNDLPRAS